MAMHAHVRSALIAMKSEPTCMQKSRDKQEREVSRCLARSDERISISRKLSRIAPYKRERNGPGSGDTNELKNVRENGIRITRRIYFDKTKLKGNFRVVAKTRIEEKDSQYFYARVRVRSDLVDRR